jgi:hypothetical protein
MKNSRHADEKKIMRRHVKRRRRKTMTYACECASGDVQRDVDTKREFHKETKLFALFFVGSSCLRSIRMPNVAEHALV